MYFLSPTQQGAKLELTSYSKMSMYVRGVKLHFEVLSELTSLSRSQTVCVCIQAYFFKSETHK